MCICNAKNLIETLVNIFLAVTTRKIGKCQLLHDLNTLLTYLLFASLRLRKENNVLTIIYIVSWAVPITFYSRVKVLLCTVYRDF